MMAKCSLIPPGFFAIDSFCSYSFVPSSFDRCRSPDLKYSTLRKKDNQPVLFAWHPLASMAGR